MAKPQIHPYDLDYVNITTATTTALGANGKQGDVIHEIIIAPQTLTPGVVSIKDGSDAALDVFAGGIGTPGLNSELRPIQLRFGRDGIRSRTGGWQIVTGAGMRVTVNGRFS